MSTENVPAQCPPWCTRAHAGVLNHIVHAATLADIQFPDLDVTVALGLSEVPGNPHIIGPFASVRINARGTRTQVDLTPRQLRMLAITLSRKRGAELMTDALHRATIALERATASAKAATPSDTTDDEEARDDS